MYPDSAYAQKLHSNTKPTTDTPEMQSIKKALNLLAHPEGGFYAETDRDILRVPNPFSTDPTSTRSASTTIYYLITPDSPLGHFHRNKARTVHTLHSGRGRYVLIHADQIDAKTGHAKIESFIVGHDVAKEEKLQWIVEGGKFKTSYLLPDSGSQESQAGLLISETVVPGFEFEDHDFLTAKGLEELVGRHQGNELSWCLKKDEHMKWES